MDNPPPESRTISKWDLRRLYNEGDIKQLAQEGNFNIQIELFTPNVVSRRIPKGSQSVGTLYFDRNTGVQIARFHNYQTPLGVMIGTFDPKFLRISGVEYHLPKRGEPEPARIGNVEINRILRKNGIPALITYLYHYAEQIQKFWKEQVTVRLIKWGLKESRS